MRVTTYEGREFLIQSPPEKSDPWTWWEKGTKDVYHSDNWESVYVNIIVYCALLKYGKRRIA